MASSVDRLTALAKSILRLASTDSAVNERGTWPSQKIKYLGKSSPSVPLSPYGIHARPKESWLSLLMTYGGRSQNRFHWVSSGNRRPTDLKADEWVMYHPPTMSEIRFKSDGSVQMTGPLMKIIGDLEVTGDVLISGSLHVVGPITTDSAVTATGEVTSGSVTLTGHTHPISTGSSSPGPTGTGTG